ncbi:MAG: hypothetical protein Q9219_002845 [cf. Caloplaca sp. 3 TL-2023]
MPFEVEIMRDLQDMTNNGTEQKIPLHLQQTPTGGEKDDFVEREIESHWPKFCSETNVWGVGVCIYKLIWLTDASYDFYGKIKNNEVIPRIKTTRKPEYTQELRDLVHDCIRFNPEERPSWSTLFRKIDRVRERFKKTWQEGQRIPDESVLCYTKEALDAMDFGDWYQRGHLFLDTPAQSYATLEDPIPFEPRM